MNSEYRYKRRFELKGKSAEEAIHHLAADSFLREWCYPNPIGSNKKEICDLLVLFGDIAILFQVKDIKFTEDEDRYARKAYEEPIRQLHGAERRLFEIEKGLSLKNSYGYELEFVASDYNKVYRIVASVGSGDAPYPPLVMSEGLPVHLFDREVFEVLTELDTIVDFSQYLEARQDFMSPQTNQEIFVASELDVLGDYLWHGRRFDHLKQLDAVRLPEGAFQYVKSQPQYVARQQLNQHSYFWDHLIDQSRVIDSPEYREITRVMSTTSRLDRRFLADSFMEIHHEAERMKKPRRRFFAHNSVTYVFLIRPPDCPRDSRKRELEVLVYVARGEYRGNAQVLGIATEFTVAGWHSYDFGLFQQRVWRHSDESQAYRLKKEWKILNTPRMSGADIIEFPILKSRKLPKIGVNERCPCGSGKKYKKCHGLPVN